MAWIGIVLKILAALPALLKVAEKAFDGVPDSGKEKKEMVMTTVKTIVGAMLSIDGDDKTWKTIEAIVDPIVDIMCKIFFPHD
jgi:hypothetical protein